MGTRGTRTGGSGAAEAAPGTMVGRYLLRDLLDTTPRHRLFTARGLAGGREVEIKVMQPRHQVRCADRGESGNPYVREMRLAAEARTECIVRHLDAGTTARGEHYLVRDRVEGQSLRTLLSAELRLMLPDAALVIADIGAALKGVHAFGYVVRDLRPELLYVRRREGGGAHAECRLGDLGMACPKGTRELTCASDHLVANPLYMAPEIATGGEATPASDIFSLASLFYEMLAGQAPFEELGSGDVQRLDALRTEPTLPPVPVRRFAPGLPADIDLLMTKCMAREPRARPTEVGQLLRGVAHVLKEHVRTFGDASVPTDLWPRLLG
ncbi:MAG: serine/threonine protein kinase [Deltaproteobacteria bacterium]|nr:serine/threonine protein kinase [Deltaproteobacteria bacterium]